MCSSDLVKAGHEPSGYSVDLTFEYHVTGYNPYSLQPGLDLDMADPPPMEPTFSSPTANSDFEIRVARIADPNTG